MEEFSTPYSRYGKNFFTVTALTAAAFGAPFALAAGLPEQGSEDNPATPVAIVSKGHPDADADDKDKVSIGDRVCPTAVDLVMDSAWNCDGVDVKTTKLSDVEDADLTTTRAIRQEAMQPLRDVEADIAKQGDDRIGVSTTTRTVAIAQKQPGDDTTYVITVIHGPRDGVRDMTGDIWETLTGSPVPAEADSAISSFEGE